MGYYRATIFKIFISSVISFSESIWIGHLFGNISCSIIINSRRIAVNATWDLLCFPLTLLFSFKGTGVAVSTMRLFLCRDRAVPVHGCAPVSLPSILEFSKTWNKRVLSEDGYLIAFTSLAIESQCKTLLCFLLKEEVDFPPKSMIVHCGLGIILSRLLTGLNQLIFTRGAGSISERGRVSCWKLVCAYIVL